MRPRQNGRHFAADDIFKSIFLNENMWILVNISLKFVTKGQINNIPALVQIMAWRWPGDKPLSEPMMVSLHASLSLNELTFNSWSLVIVAVHLNVLFSSLLHRMIIWALSVKVPSDECHRTPLMINQHWFRQLLGAIRQQANVDPDLCHHMVLNIHAELF